MNITKVSPDFAKDFIELINGMKGITYDGQVDYTTKTGGRTKFQYVTLDKMYSKVKENPSFAVIEPLGTNENGDSALQVVLIHKSGEAITSDYYKLRINEGGSKQDEGSAITYTKRYALGSFLGLCTDEDNDANPDGEGMPLKKEGEGNNAQTVFKLSEKQVNRLYAIAKSKGQAETAVNTLIFKKYGKKPPELARDEYEEVCKGYEDMVEINRTLKR